MPKCARISPWSTRVTTVKSFREGLGSAHFRRRRRGERRQIVQTELLLDPGDAPECVLEAVFAEHAMFEILELLGELIVLRLGNGRLPRRKDDRVFDRGVVLVHADERRERARERCRIRRPDAALLRDHRYVVGDLTP